VLYT